MRENLSIDICEHGNEKGSCELCEQKEKKVEEYKLKSPKEAMGKCPHGKFYKDCTICSAIMDTERSVEEEEAKMKKSLTRSKEKGEGVTADDLEIPSPEEKGEELAPPASKSKKPRKKFGEGIFDDEGRLINQDK